MTQQAQAGAEQHQTRRERQREATYTEIVRTSRALLAEGAELSLRAVAGRMGMTPPALYRYVAGYQELVDIVAFEIDRDSTAGFRKAASAVPSDDPAGRLAVAVTEFRRWALTNKAEFTLVFANPVADAACIRREMLTLSSSGHYFTDLIFEIWQQRRFDVPRLADVPPSVQDAVAEPLIPANVEQIPADARGLVWIYMQGWTRLYGIVALEVFGHMDPRVIESGEMFLDAVTSFAPSIGVSEPAEIERLEALVRERLRDS